MSEPIETWVVEATTQGQNPEAHTTDWKVVVEVEDHGLRVGTDCYNDCGTIHADIPNEVLATLLRKAGWKVEAP